MSKLHTPPQGNKKPVSVFWSKEERTEKLLQPSKIMMHVSGFSGTDSDSQFLLLDLMLLTPQLHFTKRAPELVQWDTAEKKHSLLNLLSG